MDDKLSSIIKEFPEYLFDSINSAKLEARKSGKDVVDLGYGNPDIPSHPLVVEKLIESARLTKNHKYSVSRGIQGLRNAITEKYSRSYDVSLDPEKNIVNTIGSKEGLTHLMFSIINPGDKVIIPDPSYPIHQYAPLISRAKVKKVQLKDTNEFLESIEKITSSEDIKLVLISFPHNPTTLTVDLDFYNKLVHLGQKRGFWIVNDFAYSDVYFDDKAPPSLLQAEGAIDNCIELYSLTKGYSMAGWRVGFAIGNEKAIGALTKIKSYIDYGTFQPIQIAAANALNRLDEYPKEVSSIYLERREIVKSVLQELRFNVQDSNATMFVWAKIPENINLGSIDFSIKLLKNADVAVAPGLGFGDYGEGYVRIALVENKNRIRQAMKNMKRMMDD
jgi:alanine-synthesizing transaminase|tara:strand:- start:53 stop:1222 length:1170 start_codon:yes stop_codon:yes gene_type:complete